AGGAWVAPNFAKAQKLVRASGTRGTKVTLMVSPADATNPTATVGRYVSSVLDDLGYRTSVRFVADPYSTAGDSRNHFQIAWFGWQADYDAPSDFIGTTLSCPSFVAQQYAEPQRS